MQSARKKRYCIKIGCALNELLAVCAFGVSVLKLSASPVAFVRLLILAGNGGSGGGGESGRDGDAGVALSMRAQVK